MLTHFLYMCLKYHTKLFNFCEKINATYAKPQHKQQKFFDELYVFNPCQVFIFSFYVTLTKTLFKPEPVNRPHMV